MKRLIAALALLTPLAAHAWSFEYGAGVTSYTTEDGRWYQFRMPSKLTTIAPEYSIGVTGPLLTRGASGIDWRASYVNLGRASAACTCDTSDENYIAHRTQHTAAFSGGGRAQGAALTLEPYRWFGGWRVGVEAGAFIYHASWSETITGWTVSAAPPQNLSLSASSWQIAPVVGATVGNGVWSLAYRHYFMKRNSERQNIPPVWNDADVLEIKRSF
jgi:hypothetical protein